MKPSFKSVSDLIFPNGVSINSKPTVYIEIAVITLEIERSNGSFKVLDGASKKVKHLVILNKSR